MADPTHPISLGSLTGFTSGVDSVVFSPDGRTLAAGGDAMGHVRLWAVR
jgi:hypothetical protein